MRRSQGLTPQFSEYQYGDVADFASVDWVGFGGHRAYSLAVAAAIWAHHADNRLCASGAIHPGCAAIDQVPESEMAEVRPHLALSPSPHAAGYKTHHRQDTPAAAG